MKEKERFIKVIQSLLFSWGSDAPAEAWWAANDLLDWVEAEYGIRLGIRFNGEEAYGNDDIEDNYDQVIEVIRKS